MLVASGLTACNNSEKSDDSAEIAVAPPPPIEPEIKDPEALKNRASPTLRRLGLHYYNYRAYEQALPFFQAYSNKNRGDAEGHFFLGRTLLALNEPTQAREHFQVATTLAPTDLRFAQGLADAEIASGDPQAAIATLERAITEGYQTEAFLRLGRTAEDLGLLDEAVIAYRRAAAVDEGASLEAQQALARIAREIGDEDEEIKRLRILLGMTPDDPTISARLRGLGRIPGPSYVLPPSAGLDDEPDGAGAG